MTMEGGQNLGLVG